jgi:hypothetical protein
VYSWLEYPPTFLELFGCAAGTGRFPGYSNTKVPCNWCTLLSEKQWLTDLAEIARLIPVCSQLLQPHFLTARVRSPRIYMHAPSPQAGWQLPTLSAYDLWKITVQVRQASQANFSKHVLWIHMRDDRRPHSLDHSNNGIKISYPVRGTTSWAGTGLTLGRSAVQSAVLNVYKTYFTTHHAMKMNGGWRYSSVYSLPLS